MGRYSKPSTILITRPAVVEEAANPALVPEIEDFPVLTRVVQRSVGHILIGFRRLCGRIHEAMYYYVKVTSNGGVLLHPWFPET